MSEGSARRGSACLLRVRETDSIFAVTRQSGLDPPTFLPASVSGVFEKHTVLKTIIPSDVLNIEWALIRTEGGKLLCGECTPAVSLPAEVAIVAGSCCLNPTASQRTYVPSGWACSNPDRTREPITLFRLDSGFSRSSGRPAEPVLCPCE